MCVLANLEHLSILFCAVLWAAAPGLGAALPMWDSAYVSGTVTSQAIDIIIIIIIITVYFIYFFCNPGSVDRRG